jgi:hypothetical protein
MATKVQCIFEGNKVISCAYIVVFSDIILRQLKGRGNLCCKDRRLLNIVAVRHKSSLLVTEHSMQ